jgi:hypothetical protein
MVLLTVPTLNIAILYTSCWVLARPHLAHNVSHVSLPCMGMWVEQHVRRRAVAQVGVMALADACTVAMHPRLSAIRAETQTCRGAHVPIHAPKHPPEKILENQPSLAGSCQPTCPCDCVGQLYSNCIANTTSECGPPFEVNQLCRLTCSCAGRCHAAVSMMPMLSCPVLQSGECSNACMLCCSCAIGHIHNQPQVPELTGCIG